MITSTRCLHRGLSRNNTRFLSASHVPRKKLLRPLPAPSVIHIRRYAANGTTNASSASATANEGRGIAGKIFFSSLCVGTFGLGAWQTRRYFRKVEMTQKREDDLMMDPLSGFDDWQTLKNNNLANDEVGDSTKSYRRVHLRGRFRHDGEMLIGPRGPPPGALAESGPNSGRGGGGGMSSSTQGYWVVTPFIILNEEYDATIQTMEGCQVEDAKPKRGWLGKLWGESSKSSESGAMASDLDATSAQEPSAVHDEEVIVWIKRGWIPRTHVTNDNELSTPWYRPQGIVQLLSMESSTENPGTFTPPSRLDSKKQNMNKLLWMDRKAMEEMTSRIKNSCHPPLFVEIDTDEKNKGPPRYPVKPSKEFVGEFKVSPEVHAGYAVTWFGLSGAGIVMTRKLLRMGR